jgi:NAD(P)-dependent dehydrogenase (short-subunit alcohol dehydrogenase family)
VFANAGITGPVSLLKDLSVEDLQDVVQINVVGAFLTAQAAVKHMAKSAGGSGGTIVIMSSRAAQLGSGGEFIHYAASKGAMDTLTIGLAKEVAPEGIRVNAVGPGLIDTDIHNVGDGKRLERLLPGVPMGRIGGPEEVADVVVWLSGPSSSYVTGSIIPISGGR